MSEINRGIRQVSTYWLAVVVSALRLREVLCVLKQAAKVTVTSRKLNDLEAIAVFGKWYLA
jgi:hypothetical protein